MSNICSILCLLRFANAFSYYGLVLLTTELFQEGGACGSESLLRHRQTPSHTQGHTSAHILILHTDKRKKDNVVQWRVCVCVCVLKPCREINVVFVSKNKRGNCVSGLYMYIYLGTEPQLVISVASSFASTVQSEVCTCQQYVWQHRPSRCWSSRWLLFYASL